MRQPRRAPGAEHPVKVRKRRINPLRLVRLTDAQVDDVVDAAKDRAVGDTLYHQPARQLSAPNAGPEERIR